MIAALACSAAAGLGGLFLSLNSKWIGGLALVPGVFAIVESTLNLQGKANWHYRKKYGLEKLRRRLLFEIPESPSADDVAAISISWAKLRDSMQSEWEKGFRLSWGNIRNIDPHEVGNDQSSSDSSTHTGRAAKGRLSNSE